MPRRVIVLALDGASPALLRQWSNDGALPNLRSLLNRGLSGTVRGLDGFYIGSTWPSFCTGVSPARHGFHYQRQLAPGTYGLREVADGEPTREPPFWRALSDAGKRVAILDVPLTKLDPTINGVQIVEWGVHDDLYGFDVTPRSLEQSILRSHGRHPVGGRCDAPRRSAADYRDFTDTLVRGIRNKTRLTLEVAALEPWDLLIQVFSESHCAGHQCWHLHDPAHPAHAGLRSAVDADPIRQVYQALDGAIGELAHAAGDALLIVLTSHGMTHWYGAHFLLREILSRLGATVRLAESPTTVPAPTGPAALAAHAWRALPSGLRTALAPVRDRLRRASPERPSTIAEGLDAGASKCFVVNNGLGTSGIRLNLAGREPAGCLQPGADTEKFIDTLTSDLLSLRHADSDLPAVRRVLRTDAVYAGPALDVLPDLVVEWSTEVAIGSALVGSGEGAKVRLRHPAVGITEGTNVYGRTGEHEPDGLFVAAGPGIAPGALERPVSILDFAPTICRLLDCRCEDAEGAVIRELVAEP